MFIVSLDSVLAVIALMFAEGWTLCGENEVELSLVEFENLENVGLDMIKNNVRST